MNWKILLNPFSKFSEKQLLIVGILITIIGILIGTYVGVIFDGVFDAHVFDISFDKSVLVIFIDILTMFLILFFLGKIINPKTRMIDILNVSMISRFPIYIVGLFTNNSEMNRITDDILKQINTPESIDISTLDMVFLLTFSSAMMLFLVYSIFLIVSGFRTATNIKKWQHFVLFAIALLLAEIVSKILIYGAINFI